MRKYLKQSIAAGMLIGIGDIINVSCSNKYIGAVLFSLGLLYIISNNLTLYTSKIGFYKLYSKVELFSMLIFNFIGVSIPTTLYFFMNKFNNIESKYDIFNYSYLSMLIAGILCGICMYIAVSGGNQIITIFAIYCY